MRIPRVFVAQPLMPGATLELDAPAARHLLQVLRLEHDAPLVLFNGDGHDYAARLHKVHGERVSATVAARGISSGAHSTGVHDRAAHHQARDLPGRNGGAGESEGGHAPEYFAHPSRASSRRAVHPC